ncbi:MAG: tetratricopeptide repeat protein, partial [Woeseia sp.]
SWQESIDTNLASAAAARKDNAASEELHALDYQVYAYLQTGQDAAARKVLMQSPAIAERIASGSTGNAAPSPAGYFANAAIAARFALERNAWGEAAVLPVRATRFEWVDAITHFARALGAARSGDIIAAKTEVETLAVTQQKLEEAGNAYWAGQVAIQQKIGRAWIANAEGRRGDGLRLLREAVQMEDATEKSAISPGPLKPARELLGEMLLEQEQSAEALAEFEQVLIKEPNRFRALYGAATAAERSGDPAKAKQYFSQLLEVCERADVGTRAELTEARQVVGT